MSREPQQIYTQMGYPTASEVQAALTSNIDIGGAIQSGIAQRQRADALRAEQRRQADMDELAFQKMTGDLVSLDEDNPFNPVGRQMVEKAYLADMERGRQGVPLSKRYSLLHQDTVPIKAMQQNVKANNDTLNNTMAEVDKHSKLYNTTKMKQALAAEGMYKGGQIRTDMSPTEMQDLISKRFNDEEWLSGYQNEPEVAKAVRDVYSKEPLVGDVTMVGKIPYSTQRANYQQVNPDLTRSLISEPIVDEKLGTFKGATKETTDRYWGNEAIRLDVRKEMKKLPEGLPEEKKKRIAMLTVIDRNQRTDHDKDQMQATYADKLKAAELARDNARADKSLANQDRNYDLSKARYDRAVEADKDDLYENIRGAVSGDAEKQKTFRETVINPVVKMGRYGAESPAVPVRAFGVFDDKRTGSKLDVYYDDIDDAIWVQPFRVVKGARDEGAWIKIAGAKKDEYLKGLKDQMTKVQKNYNED